MFNVYIFRYKTPHHENPEELEDKYWQNISSEPSIYGADIPAYLTDKDQSVWMLSIKKQDRPSKESIPHTSTLACGKQHFLGIQKIWISTASIISTLVNQSPGTVYPPSMERIWRSLCKVIIMTGHW
jgi:hypothetical protein